MGKLLDLLRILMIHDKKYLQATRQATPLRNYRHDISPDMTIQALLK